MGILDKAKSAGAASSKPATDGGSKKSRYGGLAPSEGRSGFLDEAGTHDVEILLTKRMDPDANDPWLKVEVKIVTSPVLKPGDIRTIRRKLNPKAFVVTGPENIAMTMACMGFSANQLEQFQTSLESDETPGVSGGDLFELLMMCVEGDAEAVAEKGTSGAPLFGPNPLAGMKARITVSPVPPTPEYPNSRLSNYSWYPLPK